MAVDKSEIVRVTGGRQPVADSFIPPGLTVSGPAGAAVAYRSPRGLTHDVRAARQLLAEAGYASGEDLGPVRLMYNSGAAHGPIAQRLGSIWQSALGVKIRFLKKDANTFGQALKKKENKEWHLGRGGWFGDYRDPSTFLEMFVTDNGNNDCGYANEEFDALIAAAGAIDDQPRRMELFARAEERIVATDAPIVPLYHYVNHRMMRPRVRGTWPNQMDYLLLKQIRMER